MGFYAFDYTYFIYILPALLIYRYFQEDILLGIQLSELK